MTTPAEGAPLLSTQQRARTAVLDQQLRNQPVAQPRSVDPESLARLNRDATAIATGSPVAQPSDIAVTGIGLNPAVAPEQAHNGGTSSPTVRRGSGQGPGKTPGKGPAVGS